MDQGNRMVIAVKPEGGLPHIADQDAVRTWCEIEIRSHWRVINSRLDLHTVTGRVFCGNCCFRLRGKLLRKGRHEW